MIVRPVDCHELHRRATELGIAVPPELQRLLDAHAAVLKWAPDSNDELATAISGGKFTADTAAKYLESEYTRSVNDAREVRTKAANAILHTFGNAVRDGAADAMVDALRPVFDEAKAGVVDASAWITPATTAEQVLAAGDDATAAWHAVGKHRTTLDRIHDFTAMFTNTFAIVTRQPFMGHGGAPHAAFFVRDEGINLDSAAMAMTPEKATGRGGRWLRLLAVSDLTLNTPTRAAEIVAAQQTEYERLTREQYEASHPAYESA